MSSEFQHLPLAVVVPVYNEERTITTLLYGLHDQLRLGRDQLVQHVIVDNGSTDRTRQYIATWQRNHEGFPLKVIEEPERGTGAACDTGFKVAIENGAQIIARTDADCVPATDWTVKIIKNFGVRPSLQLLGGRTTALRDEHYRVGDDMLLETAILAARVVLSATHAANYLKVVNGGNMAIRAYSYENVGGIPRTSIQQSDEDVVFSRRYIKEYGMRGVHIDHNMVVATSMRRFRAYGLAGMVKHHLLPSLRANYDVDIR